MAKKAAKKMSEEKEPRLGPVDAEHLRGLVEELKDVSGDLKALILSLERSGIEQVTVDGYAKFKRGKVLQMEFIENTKHAIARAKLARG